MKICTNCGETKPLDEFHVSKASKDGRRSQCKPCHRESHRKWQRDKRLRGRQARARARAEIEKVRCLHGQCMRPGTDLPQGLGFRFCDIHAHAARKVLDHRPTKHEKGNSDRHLRAY